MATLTKLHLYPPSIDHFSFCLKDHQGTGLRLGNFPSGPRLGRGRCGLHVLPCRSFRGEDGSELEEKEIKNLKEEQRRKFKNGNGFWGSCKSAVSGFGKSSSQSSDDYNKALAKLEEVFSSVSHMLCRILFFLFCFFGG